MKQAALVTLATQINEQHRLANQAARTAVQHALRAGELLIEAKRQVKHGQWLPWLEANCAVKARQVQKYMRLVQALPNTNSHSHLTIDQLLEAVSKPRTDSRDDFTRFEEERKELEKLQAITGSDMVDIVFDIATEQDPGNMVKLLNVMADVALARHGPAWSFFIQLLASRDQLRRRCDYFAGRMIDEVGPCDVPERTRERWKKAANMDEPEMPKSMPDLMDELRQTLI